ncbi:Acetyl esterase/lipase [Arthrobacter alpinus]|uniref:Acetyl esterase/lipase n=1 Tax=Arthrobacter alpinus TaxID=656366 RepID=A0A1H5I1A7_9MICC|nr:Acetyl esterase/lipase [Arthrobacter alpinus]
MGALRKVIAYGPHSDQWGELFLPGLPTDRGVPSIVVVIHGGYWREGYTAELGIPVALDLMARGFAVWNLEYRRAGSDGAEGAGGWPATFEDVASGIDALIGIAHQYGLNQLKIAALGHSAGGHLAVWAAGRGTLPDGAPGANPKASLIGVVSQAGLLDFTAAWRLNLSAGAVENLMGSTPAEQAAHYTVADPIAHLPVGVPIHAVHSSEDESVPFGISQAYVAAAVSAGDPAELHETSGDHLAIITPGTAAYETSRLLIEKLLL